MFGNYATALKKKWILESYFKKNFIMFFGH